MSSEHSTPNHGPENGGIVWHPLQHLTSEFFDDYFDFIERMKEAGKITTDASAYTKEDLPRIANAFNKTVDLINEIGTELMLDAENYTDNKLIKGLREHETNSTYCLYRDCIIPDLLKGETLDNIVREILEEYAPKKPLKAQLIARTLPVFCEHMELPVPECIKGKLATYVVVLDDSLYMDLQARGIACNPSEIFKDAKPPVGVFYTHSAEDIKSLADYLKAINAQPEAIICDYKLHRPGEPEMWGDKVIEDFAAMLPTPPKYKFLISKSGFRDEDKKKLADQGIVYAHSNELHAIAAYQASDPVNLQFATEVAKTSNLREWANETFGTDYPTGIYKSPDVRIQEKGKIHTEEVVRRIEAGETTQLEAYQLLDKSSIEGAFRERVDINAKPVAELEMASLPPGITGRSFVGRLALSVEGAERIAASGQTPVLYVLNEDYKPAHNSLFDKINGLVMLRSGTNHIAVMARNKGIPVAFARSINSSVLSVDGDN